MTDAVPAPSEYFYYAGLVRMPLELVEDTLAVAFSEPISERRLEELRSRDRSVDILGQSPLLLARNVLIYRTRPPVRGLERLSAFAGRLLASPNVRYATYVFRDVQTGLYLIMTNQMVARFKPGVTQEQIDALNELWNVELMEQKLYATNQFVMRVRDATPDRTLLVANAYHESELTEWASPNFLREKVLRQGTLFNRQWHLNNTGQGYAGGTAANGTVFPPLAGGVVNEDVRALEAWKVSQGSGNVVIAILDTGVDTSHPDLVPNLHPGGRNFDDPNRPTDPNPDPPANPATDDGGNAHGTSCAGVAAAAGAVAMSGIAPRSKILPIKMLNADDNATADAIHYAAHNAQILSNSWGAPFSAVIEQAFLDVQADGREGAGTVVLFAVGNDNAHVPLGDQSTIEGVIAVGASTNVGSHAGYSNFCDDVDSPNADVNLRKKRMSVVAPSDSTDGNAGFYNPPAGFPNDGGTDNIYTTDQVGAPGWNPQKPGMVSFPEPAPVAAQPDYTGLFGGTSSACPLAAGICALMLSMNAGLTRAQVKYILEATADKIGTGQPRTGVPADRAPANQQASYQPNDGYDLFNGTFSRYGFGRANAEKAVKVARGDPLPQVVRQAGGSALLPGIPVKLQRIPGTNRFTSTKLVLVDARGDGDQLNQADTVFVRGGPGGFLRATFRPAGGGPAFSDEAEIEGQPPTV